MDRIIKSTEPTVKPDNNKEWESRFFQNLQILHKMRKLRSHQPLEDNFSTFSSKTLKKVFFCEKNKSVIPKIFEMFLFF